MHFCNFSRIVRDKTMDGELIYIPNEDKQNYPSVDLNHCLDTAILEPSHKYSVRIPKVLSELLR